MGFISNPEAYDVVKLGGLVLPGELDIDSIERELARQTKRGSGDDGGEPHFKGLKHNDFHLALKLHTDDDETAWALLLPTLINFSNPKSRNIFTVEHPQINRMGIRRCTVFKVGERKPKNGDPITAWIWCSSAAALKPGGSHTPTQTRQNLRVPTGAGTPTPFGPGRGPLGRLNALPLNVRSASALEQARIDNGIPINVAMPDTFESDPATNTGRVNSAAGGSIVLDGAFGGSIGGVGL